MSTPVNKETLGSYLVPVLRPVVDPVAFASAVTDIDPQTHPVCPVCGNWDVDCLCEGGDS